MEDIWEIDNLLDPLNDSDAYYDPDGDGIENRLEYILGFDPRDANTDGVPDLFKDRDNDGLPDFWKITHGLDLNDNGSVNRVNGANGAFPGSNMTNLQAYNSGVQGNPNATPTDRDGDSVEDHEDADPNDRYVDWPPAAEGSYATIQIGSLANSDSHGIMMNSAGTVFHHQTTPPVPPSYHPTEAARIWINGTWSQNISATFTFNVHEESSSQHSSVQITTYPSYLSGNYLYRTAKTFADHGSRSEFSTFTWNASSLSIPAHDSFLDLGRSNNTDYEPGTGYDFDYLYYGYYGYYGTYPYNFSDGAITRLQIRTRSGSPLEKPIACVWFPPAYVSENSTPSLQLPAGYGVTAMDASGAVLAAGYANGSTTHTLFDQGAQTPVSNDIATGVRTLGRVTFGESNQHSRLLIGGKAVKSNGAIHMRQVVPFGSNGSVGLIASNGVLLGNERIDPNASGYRPAIWRNGRSIPLTDLINPQPTSPRYSNIQVHDMNDSGLIVATAADTENNNADSKSLLLLLPVEVNTVDRDVMSFQWAQKKPYVASKPEIYAGPNSGDMIEWRLSGGMFQDQIITWKAEHIGSGEIIPGPSGVGVNFWRIANEGGNDANGDEWLKWKPGTYRITCNLFGSEFEAQRIRVGYRSDQVLVIGQIVPTHTHDFDEPTGAALATWADAIADDLSGALSTAAGILPGIVENQLYATIRPRITLLPSKAAEAWTGVWSGGIPGIAAPVLPPFSRGPSAKSHVLSPNPRFPMSP